jgi:hypothetical protein
LASLREKPYPSRLCGVHDNHIILLIPKHAPTPALYVLAGRDVQMYFENVFRRIRLEFAFLFQ